VAGAFAVLSVPVLAQTTTPTDTKSDSTVATQAVPTSRLVGDYTDLAGSKQNATSLVTGLRTGSKITLEPIQKEDKAITFTSPTKNLGNGEIKIVLAMADQRLASDTSVTNKDLYNTLMDSKTGILTLRADGMGWGQIANSYGFKLGEVMGKAPSKAATTERAASRSDKVAQRPDRPERMERLDKPDRPMKPERAERPERGR
jgi:hypothetical protein